MTKNNVEIWGQKNQILGDFAGGLGSIFGGAGEGGKLKPANTGWLTGIWHARHPGGVRRMENDAKMESKWMPKSLENMNICEKRHAENRC